MYRCTDVQMYRCIDIYIHYSIFQDICIHHICTVYFNMLPENNVMPTVVTFRTPCLDRSYWFLQAFTPHTNTIPEFLRANHLYHSCIRCVHCAIHVYILYL